MGRGIFGRFARFIVIAALAVVGTVSAGVQQAFAAELTGVITSVSVREGTVGVWDAMHVDIGYAIPEGSHAGDFFTLALDPAMEIDPTLTFTIYDSESPPNPVATAKVVDGTIVFTLTSFVENHARVTGTAFVESAWTRGEVTPGSTKTVTFTAGSVILKDTVEIPVVDTDAGAGKWVKWVAHPTDLGLPDRDQLVWGIFSGTLTTDMVGATVTIVDTPGPGSALECDKPGLPYFYVYQQNADGTKTEIRNMARSEFSVLSCTADRVEATTTVTTALVGYGVGLYGASYPTATQTRYDNSGSVKILQETTPVSSFAVRSTGGGTGEGIRVVSVGDFVWLDADHDGIQDAGEAGIPGVTLKLTGPGGAPVVDVDGMPVLPVKTDANGAYLFANLPAIPAGSSYTVTVDTAASAAALTGLFPTLTGQGTTATDSSTGFAASAADLSANGAADLTLDFGFWKPAPKVSILKGDADGNAADTSDTAVELGYEPGGVDLIFAITNEGTEPLVDVVVSDSSTNGTVSGLACVFDEANEGAPTSGTTWAGPFPVGASFTCTATLSGVMAAAGEHVDIATATGTGQASGVTVTDENRYYATVTPLPTPGVTIVKKDTAGNDADSTTAAVVLPAGATGLAFTVTNTGTEALREVTVSDAVVSGGTVSGLSCTFPDGSTGTAWAGPFAVGASFPCTATLTGVPAGVMHQDVATVTGKGEVTGKVVTSTNPYFATVPMPALPHTGSDSDRLLGFGLLFGLVGALCLGVARRRRSA